MRLRYNNIIDCLLCLLATGTAYAQSEVVDTLAIRRGEIISLGNNRNLPKWMATTGVSSFSFDDSNHVLGTNLGNQLQGRIPGLTVLQSANESGLDTPVLSVRGSGNGAPVVLVDGFEFYYDHLMPEEIESITLLKDAASTAIYGMKGANGVLLITTKKGKRGPLQVNFSLQYGFNKADRLPRFLDSYDYGRLYNEALFNDKQPIRFSDSDLEAYRTGSDPFFHPNIDWYKVVLRKTAPASKYTVSMSGGGDRVRYFVLLGAVKNAGLYRKTTSKTEFSSNSNYTRYNIRANIEVDVTKWLKANARLGFTVGDKKNPYDFSTDGMFSLLSAILPNSFPVYNLNGTYGGNSRHSNPWGNMLERGNFSSNRRTSQSSLILTHDLTMLVKGLSISGAVSFNNYFNGYSSKWRNYPRFSMSKGTDGRIEYAKFGEETSLAANESQFNQWRNQTVQASLDYNTSFGENTLSASVGFHNDSYTEQGVQTDYKHIGYNGRVTYALQNRYIGEATVGYYGATGFRRGKRFGAFPSISLGWIASNEKFLKNVGWLELLKLRASYGIAGNMLKSQRFLYTQYYSQQGSYIYGSTSVAGYADAQLANPDLTWEKKREVNVGLDIGLLKDLSFSFDVFDQLRYDILAVPYYEIPYYAGVVTPNRNIGKVKYRGFELQTDYRKQWSKDWNLSANLNLSYAKSEVVENGEVAKEDAYQNAKGKPIGQPFLLEAIGFFRDDADIKSSPLQTFGPVQPGDVKYKDQNGDGIIDSRDKAPIGYRSTPELTAGLNLEVGFKGAYISMFFHGVANRSVTLPGYYHAFQYNGKAPAMALGRWTEQTKDVATYPRLSTNSQNNHQVPSSFWQRNGNFLKLRNLEVGYNLSTACLSRIGVSKVSLFLNGANLLTWDHVKEVDPEILSGYPATKMVSVGLKVEL